VSVRTRARERDAPEDATEEERRGRGTFAQSLRVYAILCMLDAFNYSVRDQRRVARVLEYVRVVDFKGQNNGVYRMKHFAQLLQINFENFPRVSAESRGDVFDIRHVFRRIRQTYLYLSKLECVRARDRLRRRNLGGRRALLDTGVHCYNVSGTRRSAEY